MQFAKRKRDSRKPTSVCRTNSSQRSVAIVSLGRGPDSKNAAFCTSLPTIAKMSSHAAARQSHKQVECEVCRASSTVARVDLADWTPSQSSEPTPKVLFTKVPRDRPASSLDLEVCSLKNLSYRKIWSLVKSSNHNLLVHHYVTVLKQYASIPFPPPLPPSPFLSPLSS